MLGEFRLESFSVSQQVIALSSEEEKPYAPGQMVTRILSLIYTLKEVNHVGRGRVLPDSSACRGMLGRKSAVNADSIPVGAGGNAKP